MWTADCHSAFQESKSVLALAVMLNHPYPEAETKLSVDASKSALGAELSQRHELLAIHSAIKHFHYFLEGNVFSVYTDHKPLTNALDSDSDRTPRQDRKLSYIAEFTTDMRHISWLENIVPDTLSRAPFADPDPVISDPEPLVACASPVPAVDLKTSRSPGHWHQAQEPTCQT